MILHKVKIFKQRITGYWMKKRGRRLGIFVVLIILGINFIGGVNAEQIQLNGNHVTEISNAIVTMKGFPTTVSCPYPSGDPDILYYNFYGTDLTTRNQLCFYANYSSNPIVSGKVMVSGSYTGIGSGGELNAVISSTCDDRFLKWDSSWTYVDSTGPNWLKLDPSSEYIVCDVTYTNHCTNTCSPSGLQKCNGNNVETCGDYNNDGCYEWGNAVACQTGRTCTGTGVCSLTLQSSFADATAVLGTQYTVKCNFGVAGLGCIQSGADCNPDTTTPWKGTSAVFSCPAGNVLGSKSNYCNLITTAEQGCVAKENIIPQFTEVVECITASDCNDKNVCNGVETCNTGTGRCVAGIPLNCNDDKACTDDTCNPLSGCVFTNDNTNTCTDSNLCTTDTCSSGNCNSVEINCNDGISCTVDNCESSTGNCLHNNAACTCASPSDIKCNDGNPCTIDSCNMGTLTCQNLPGNLGAVCRAFANSCNPEDKCDGININCPTDSTITCGADDDDLCCPSGCTNAQDKDCPIIVQCTPSNYLDVCPAPNSFDFCKKAICDAGVCKIGDQNNGNSCPDDFCSEGKTCKDGVCSGGTLIKDSLGNPKPACQEAPKLEFFNMINFIETIVIIIIAYIVYINYKSKKKHRNKEKQNNKTKNIKSRLKKKI